MAWLILAELGRAERLRAIREGFTSKSEAGSGVYTGLLIVVALGVVAIVVLALLHRFAEGTGKSSGGTPNSLFREVLRELPLGFQDKALLRRMAGDMQLANPTTVLLTPGLFEQCLQEYAAAHPKVSERDLHRYEAISQQLFQFEPTPSGSEAGTHDEE